MRFSISIPQFHADGEFDPEALREHLRRAEELGFEGGWTQEQVLGTKPQLGAIETLAFAAACTTTLRLGCSVFVLPLRNPVHLAKSMATLDQMSGGRIEIGLGAGGRNRNFAAFGLSPEGLVTRFTEGLEVMRALWSEPSVTLDGRFWQLENASMEPKPVQKPAPPVWIGGSAPAALKRAARLGDGFFGAGSTTTENFAGQVEAVRGELEARHRDPAGFQIAKRVYVAVGDDAGRAGERMSQALRDLYGPFADSLGNVAVTGTPADCARGIREVVDAGAEMVLCTPMFDEREQMERLAAEVLPDLR